MKRAGEDFDVAVIGAGPAGMAAATTIADGGPTVVLLDEQPRVGGQIFRQPPAELQQGPLSIAPGYPWARALIEACESHQNISFRPRTTAWGTFREHPADGHGALRVATYADPGGSWIGASRLVIATGAYDLPVAFPGWTLPGVMMAGAVQSLLKSQRVRAPGPVVLVGSHPLLIILADQLIAAGGEVLEVAMARGLPTPREMVRALSAIPGHVRLLTSLAGAMTRLRRAGVRISTHTVVDRAHGSDRARAVSLRGIDGAWQPTAPARVVVCNTLVVGYGFLPSVELARQAGCEVRWAPSRGGWVVAHDHQQRTTVPDVFVAGEPTGVAGAEQSHADGLIAGETIVRDLTGTALPARRTRAKAARARSFARVVEWMFPPPLTELADLVDDDTVVCRCESVNAGQIRALLDHNPHVCDVNAVKIECRAGMGPCQGRYCGTTVAAITAQRRGMPIDQVGAFTAQVPVRPVPLAAISGMDS